MLELSERDAIATLRMAHGKVNALDLEFCEELMAALAEVEQSSARLLVIAGNERVFSAGVDLKRWLAEGVEYVEPFLTVLEDTFRTIFEFPRPVIAEVAGHAIAGGCMIAAACDYRLIGPQTRIGIPELRIGVPLPMTAIEIVRAIARPQAFQRMIGVGATYVGQAAVDAGLADEVAAVETMAGRLREVVEEHLAVPLGAYRLTKEQIRRPIVRQMEANHREFHSKFIELWKASETRAAVARYVKERLSN